MKTIKFALISFLSCSGLYAGNVLSLSTPKLDRPTLTALGVQLPITGDDNYNSTVSLQYRVTGTQPWLNGLPLFRVHPETVAGYTVAQQFAGSIFDLKPGTSYDIQLHAVDPDGLDQTLTLNAATRPVPGDPIAPRAVTVTDSGSLVNALNNAAPGDVITLANGIYPGQFSISHGGTAANPIVIRGASEDGVVLDGGNCIPCNIFELYGPGYVHLERMTMQNAERAIRLQQDSAVGNVIRRVHVKNTTLGIGGRSNQNDTYIADNILEGRLAWPHLYSDDGGAFANSDGIAVFGFGDVVAHNRISGYGDAMKTEQDGARANDFYGNDILFTYDNGIELDGSEGNTRCMRNRFTNTFATISVQPIHGGPSYILRNVVVNAASEQLKFHALNGNPPQEPSGVLVYNNTFVSAPKLELNLQTNAASHYFEIENNLFIAPPTSGPEAADWTGVIDHGTFDYNGYFPDGIFRFNNPSYGGYFFQPNFAGLQSLGMERHGVIANGSIFANGMSAPSTYTIQVPPPDATLAAGSVSLDRGRVLPNINDNYQGSGPDFGALELGCPSPSYGPRPEGVDETNEVFGCVAASGAAAVNSPATSSVSVAPATVTLGRSQTRQFTVTTVPAGGAVTWKISPARGTINSAGLYTAPADGLLGETVTITAASATGNVSGTAMVNLTAPVAVAVSPTSVTVSGSQNQRFTATVSGALNNGVSWILSPPIGYISIDGVYSEPPATYNAQSITVTAVSTADSTKIASANVTVNPAPGSLTITPAITSVRSGTTLQFGSSSPALWIISPSVGYMNPWTGLYTAPTVGVPTAVTINAYCLSNFSQRGTLTFTVQP